MNEYIVHIGAEAVPFSKVGGLGDIIGCLPTKINENYKSNNIVFTPHYSNISKKLYFEGSFSILFNSIKYEYGVYSSRFKDVTYYFIEFDPAFKMDNCYVDGSKPYLIDVGLEYFFFGKCCVDYLKNKNINNYKVITHDWHASGIYAYIPDAIKSIHIIHNYQHQGQLYPDIIHFLEPEVKQIANKIVSDTGILTMNSFAIYKSTKIVTVSPNYAKELIDGTVAHPSLDLFHIYNKSVIGILNGVDYDKWNPSRRDIKEIYPYTINDLEIKKDNKKFIKSVLKLETSDSRPLLLILSRLTHQKGLDLFVNMGNRKRFSPKERLEKIISAGYDLVICGVPAGGYRGEVERCLNELKDQFTVNFRYINNYSDELAHKLLCASDVLMHVSNYEPCGLTPMYAMKYGVVPLVSNKGGLDNIVNDNKKDNLLKNGFKVNRVDFETILKKLTEIIGVYIEKNEWERIVYNCMKMDFSWDKSVNQYIKLIKEL